MIDENVWEFGVWSFKGPSLKSSPVNPDWNVGLFDLCFLPLMVCLKTSFDQKLVNGQKSVSLKSPVCAQNDRWPGPMPTIVLL